MFAFRRQTKVGEWVVEMIDGLDEIFAFFAHPLTDALRARVAAHPEGLFLSFRSGYSGQIIRVA